MSRKSIKEKGKIYINVKIWKISYSKT